LRQRVALVATLARLYVGVVLIDRDCECRAAIVAGSWALCTITCASSSVTSASATAAGLRPGNMSQIGARSAYLALRDFDPANVSCGSNRVVLTVRQPLLVFPDKQTFETSVGISQGCQQRKSAALFDDPVRELQNFKTSLTPV